MALPERINISAVKTCGACCVYLMGPELSSSQVMRVVGLVSFVVNAVMQPSNDIVCIYLGR